MSCRAGRAASGPQISAPPQTPPRLAEVRQLLPEFGQHRYKFERCGPDRIWAELADSGASWPNCRFRQVWVQFGSQVRPGPSERLWHRCLVHIRPLCGRFRSNFGRPGPRTGGTASRHGPRRTRCILQGPRVCAARGRLKVHRQRRRGARRRASPRAGMFVE